MVVEFILSAHRAKVTKLSGFRKQNACPVLGLSYAALNLDQMQFIENQTLHKLSFLKQHI